jgi:protein ImuB
MYAVLYLPDFRLQAAVRDAPELADLPLALLDAPEGEGGGEKSRGKIPIIEVSPAARASGILSGMTASQAQARHAELQLHYRRPLAEKALQGRLLDLAADFTPDYEATAPGICTLDLVGSPHAREPGGAESFGRAAIRQWAQEKLHATTGIADNPDLALLAARLAAALAEPTRIIRGAPDAIRAQLAPLPVAALDPSEETRKLLALWGIHTFGDLLALPREDAAERLGAEAARLWSLARGGRPRLLRLVRAPESFAQTVEFEFGIETLEPLVFSLRRLLETLAARLAAVYRVAGSLTLTLVFSDASTHARLFRVPEPSRDVDLLFRILHTHLDGFTAASPVTVLALDAQPVRAGSSQFHLFESSLRDPNRFAETLARLEALLGSERVGAPEYTPSHRPDPGGMRPFLTDAAKPPTEETLGTVPLEMLLKLGPALRRFRPPVPVRVASDRNRVPLALVSGPALGRFRQVLGPCLVSGNWWERGTLWSRREWDVQLEDGALYRLVSQHPGTEWLLDGVYR